MKRPWIIVFVVLAAGIALSAFFFAQPQKVIDTPTRIPERNEVVPPGSSANDLLKTADEGRVPQLMIPTSLVRTATDRLLKESCDGGTERCKLLAIYDFVRLNFEYTERTLESPYLRSPSEMLLYARGDEIELAMLLASMQRAAGFRNEIVRSPTSAWVRVYQGNESIMIDPSCTGCSIMGANVILRGDEIVYN
jgi:transglutaminase-like putative cysteine protease